MTDREQPARDACAWAGNGEPVRLSRGEAALMIVTLSVILWVVILLVAGAFG